ncbi:MAG: SMI1/KNR4 family protein [Candidatus Cloacimonetes bacterium]|nr:SMI1/KNR4 family protein [Candidatus Cloacimonadota bacterium]
MLKLMKKIEERHKLYTTGGVSLELINEAEKQLKVKFAADYREYLSKFGAISFGSTELTGLNIDSYANVVSVTLKEAQRNKSFPSDSIVVENTGMEGLLVLQKDSGEVYEWMDGAKGATYPDLMAYLESKIGA